MNLEKAVVLSRLIAVLAVLAMVTSGGVANAAVPGITSGPYPASGTYTFSLTAADGYMSQPDGTSLYSWGYGCSSTFTPNFSYSAGGPFCPTMQVPGPTLIVTEGQTVVVNLTNN